MDVDALIANIHFAQKFILIFFLLALSIFYLWKVRKKQKNKSLSVEDEENIFKEFFNELMNWGAKIYLLIFPITLVFLEYTVSFYIFVGLLLGFYLVFVIVFSIVMLYKYGYKFTQWLERRLS